MRRPQRDHPGGIAQSLSNLTLAVVRSTDPATELIPIVRWLGQQRKIFNVHFRNIAGGLHSFREVWPDEGDVDMFALVGCLQEVDYEWMLMPDHLPTHDDDPIIPGSWYHRGQAWAYAFGYINCLIQAARKAEGAGWEAVRIAPPRL